ncbi:Cation/H(+) antiporter [Thalictrum thalictroides]|uniref:Cation/H(+) antiporter n=1 Tax=Thalictrum thalictroides TaxID=46969 RepID=A0A7J6WCT4_THATH|nr:Cation/H(+) antiporter [Thalictrum thalictroides]
MAVSNQTGLPLGDPTVICYSPTKLLTNLSWTGDKVYKYDVPVFIMQIILIVSVTRLLFFILKPLRQPRVVSEILGGILLGPSVLGRSKKFAVIFFPQRGIMVLETMANIGLLFFLFIVGVQMDLAVIKSTGKKAMIIAILGMVAPFTIGTSVALLVPQPEGTKVSTSFLLFLGIAVSVTAFPVLARILAELKLLNTELGKIAMSSALINDMCAWVVLAIAIALSEKDAATLATSGVILSSVAFVLVCIYVVRPMIYWVIRQTPEGESVHEFYICLILTGVMVCGFITDGIGTHCIFGAFVYGLVIPNGPLGATLIEKLEDFVSGMLLPLFFAISGLRTDIRLLVGQESDQWGYLLLIVVLACAAKVGVTLLVAVYYQMPYQEGLALGLLMNTKGLIEIIILNVGQEQEVLDSTSFSVMVLVAVATTSIVTPTIMTIYKPARRLLPYKRRTIQRSKQESELRIVACVHTPRNVPPLLSLLEASNPTKRFPIHAYVLHLVELSGRASDMLIAHNTGMAGGGPALNQTQAQSNHIINALENYEQHAGGVSVLPLTAISPYISMHEDVCQLAEDKRVAFIILPFHKQQTVDGGMEVTHPAYRTINQNVLANAPCSVGILVDRGLGSSTRAAASYQIAVLFFGGPDDREALSYASRMVEHPGTCLTIIRFFPGEESRESKVPHNDDSNEAQRVLTVITDNEKDKQRDDEFIHTFRLKTANNKAIAYREELVYNGEETVAAIHSIDSAHDLYIVGKGQGTSPLTAGITDWSECPELGAIGDLLSSSDFAATVSVLVVQQYVGSEIQEGHGTPDSQAQQNDFYNNIHNMSPSPPTNGTQPMPQRGVSSGYGNSWST